MPTTMNEVFPFLHILTSTVAFVFSLFLKKDLFLFYVYEAVFLTYTSVYHMHARYPQRSEAGIELPRTEVTDRC